MTLPAAFGWFVLLVLALLVGRLTKVPHGWKIIAATVVAASLVAAGFQLGHDSAIRDAARSIRNLDLDTCRTAYNLQATQQLEAVGGCLTEIGRVRSEVDAIRLPAWLFFACVIGATGGLFYLAYSIDYYLRTLGQSTAVVTPKPDKEEAEERPRQRRSKKGPGNE